MGGFPATTFILVAIILTALYLRRMRMSGRPLVPAKGVVGQRSILRPPGP